MRSMTSGVRSRAIRHAASGALALAAFTGSARASLPVFGGPTYAYPDGYKLVKYQGYTVAAKTFVSNAGVTVGEALPATTDTNQENQVGKRTFRWGPNLPLMLLPNRSSDVGTSTLSVAGITGAGLAIGVDRANTYASVTWSPDAAATVTALPVTDPDNSPGDPRAISPSGAFIAGTQTHSGSGFGLRAARYDQTTGAVTTLNPIVIGHYNFAESLAADVNDSGTVVGSSYLYNTAVGSDFGDRPVRWDAGSATPTVLGTLGTSATGAISYASAIAINNAGTAVGFTEKYETVNGSVFDRGRRALRWDAGSTTGIELGNLGTDANGVTQTTVTAINEAGTILGSANTYDASGQTGLFVVKWNPGSTVATALPTTGGATGAHGIAMNNLGAVVGYEGSGIAVVWTPQNAAIPLDTLSAAESGWVTMNEASGISDTGFVSGWGMYDPDGAGTQTAYPRMFSMLVPQAGTYGQGDANFDTHVDFADLLVLAKHYGQASNGATNAGDLDLNGVVDFNDLLTLAKHYGSAPSGAELAAATSASFASEFALAQSLVPEPTVTAFALLLVASGGRRRRGR